MPSTSFVARLWTPSINFISFIKYGLQIGIQYSKCGLTMLLYNAGIVSFDLSIKFRFIIPNTLFPFFTAAMHCFFHFKSLLIITPKISLLINSLQLYIVHDYDYDFTDASTACYSVQRIWTYSDVYNRNVGRYGKYLHEARFVSRVWRDVHKRDWMRCAAMTLGMAVTYKHHTILRNSGLIPKKTMQKEQGQWQTGLFVDCAQVAPSSECLRGKGPPDRMLAKPWRRLFLTAYTFWAKPGCCCPARVCV